MSQLFQVNGRWITLQKYQEVLTGEKKLPTERKTDTPVSENKLSAVESIPVEKHDDSIDKMLE